MTEYNNTKKMRCPKCTGSGHVAYGNGCCRQCGGQGFIYMDPDHLGDSDKWVTPWYEFNEEEQS